MKAWLKRLLSRMPGLARLVRRSPTLHAAARQVFATPTSREAKVLHYLNRAGLGLEIGPSHNPVAPKRQGFNVHILDHLSAAGLREKYADHARFGVRVENIEEVDFVWNGEDLRDLIGQTGCYDWIISSHVIEHIPNVIAHLQQCEALLKPDGKMSLVIPDMRYCFDTLGSVNTTGDFLDAYEQSRTRPSPGAIFDHFASACQRDNCITWDATQALGHLQLMHGLEDAKALWQRARTNSEYIDTHCWRFTPASFQLLISDLQALGLLRIGIIGFFETHGCEFYATLGQVSDQPRPDRLVLLQTMQDEWAQGRVRAA